MGVLVNVVVVPKNSGLKGYAWKVLQEAGFDLERAEKVRDNSLVVDGIEVLLRRGEDIPLIVEEEKEAGRFAVGVTGDDLFDEYRLRNPGNNLMLVNTYDWDDAVAEFRRPALCLMSIGAFADPSEIKIGIPSKYEYTARSFIRDSPLFEGYWVQVKCYNGDVEDALERGYVRLAIDTVYSGKSRRQAGLEIVERIRASDLAVIAPKNGASLLEKMASGIPRGPIIDRRQISELLS